MQIPKHLFAGSPTPSHPLCTPFLCLRVLEHYNTPFLCFIPHYFNKLSLCLSVLGHYNTPYTSDALIYHHILYIHIYMHPCLSHPLRTPLLYTPTWFERPSVKVAFHTLRKSNAFYAGSHTHMLEPSFALRSHAHHSPLSCTPLSWCLGV